MNWTEADRTTIRRVVLTLWWVFSVMLVIALIALDATLGHLGLDLGSGPGWMIFAIGGLLTSVGFALTTLLRPIGN